MGVDAGDVDDNGWPDFVVTNFDREYHALYLNPGRFPFAEHTVASGLARHTRAYVGWGTRFLDADLDGDLDLLIVNGHLHENIELSNVEVKHREKPLLLINQGQGQFADAAAAAGPAFAKGYVGRSLAAGDYNNDGAVDAVFISLNAPPVLLRNHSRGAWVGARLRGTRSNRDAIGARLTATRGGRKQVRWISGGGSFQASHDRRVVFGLGADAGPVDLEIRWPNGGVQTVRGLAPGRYHEIVETDEAQR
jgi:hypothetical protein